MVTGHRARIATAGWTVREFLVRVFDNSSDDNIFFLAGGIAFNILLAGIPLLLLIVTGMVYFFAWSPERSITDLIAVLTQLAPASPATEQVLSLVLADILRSAGAVTILGVVTFIWFSTRLFGSLRWVLAEVFDIEDTYGPVKGKIFDAKITVVASLLVVLYFAISAYLVIATSRGILVLAELGIRQDVMAPLEYALGRLIAFSFITLMFWALYRFLPQGRLRRRTALVAALFTSIMFEIARWLFALYVQTAGPGSFYQGTIAAVVITVFWVYYAALIFVLGGEVAQVYELRRVRKMQHEVFE